MGYGNASAVRRASTRNRAPRAFGGAETIADAWFGEDEARLGRVFLELLAQQRDIAPQILGIRCGISPAGQKEALVRDEPPSAADFQVH